MTLSASVVVVAAIVLVSFLVVLAVLVAGRKATRMFVGARHAAADAIVRDALMALVSLDESDVPVRPRARLRKAERRVALHLLERIRGEGRERLLALLDERGTIAAATRRVQRRGAIGRASSAVLLGHLGGHAATGDLASLLSARNVNLRSAAARATGEIGDSAAVPALLAVAEGPAPVSPNIVASSILRIGGGAIEPLRAAYPGASPAGRTTIVELLGFLGAVSAVDDIAGGLVSDSDVAARSASAVALGRIGVPRALPPLLEALGRVYEDVRVRTAAAAALGQIGASESVPALVAAVGSCEHELAHAAAASLTTVGPLGLARLEALASATAGSSRAYAAEALARRALAGSAAGSAA